MDSEAALAAELEKELDDADDIVTTCPQERRKMLDGIHADLDKETGH